MTPLSLVMSWMPDSRTSAAFIRGTTTTEARVQPTLRSSAKDELPACRRTGFPGVSKPPFRSQKAPKAPMYQISKYDLVPPGA